MGKYVDSGNIPITSQMEKEDIDSLIADLASKDSITRVKARRSLVSRGHKAVPLLLTALSSKNQWVRWEAAKALSQIHDSASVEGLVVALRDKMFDVRWLAAEGLVAIGNKSLTPLLQALIHYPDSVWMREGAHHVLHDLVSENLEKVLSPVLRALEDIATPIEVPFVAKVALDALKKHGK